MKHRMKVWCACLLACVLAIAFGSSAHAQTQVAPCVTIQVTASDGTSNFYCKSVSSTNPLPVTGSGAAGTTTTVAGTTTGGTTLAAAVANAAASRVVAAQAANLYGAYAKNATATAGYLVAYNATTAPTNGASLTASLILECLALPASGQTSLSYGSGPPEAFSIGIVLLVSSTDCSIASPVYTTGTVTAYLHGVAQ